MHALAGIISRGSSPPLAHPPQRMFDRLRHTAESVQGSQLFEPGVRVGWVRSHAATTGLDAPAWSTSGHVGVLFAGEDFSRDAGSTSTSAALANDYERDGLPALGRLNGWFSGVILDRRNGATVLFNDRLGRGRIYYHTSPAGGFFFASEAKSLLAVLPQLRQLDPRSLAEWFSVGCVLQDRTLFTGVALLPPASAWTFHRDGRLTKEQYFHPAAWERQASLSPSAFAEKLRDVFSRVAPRYAGGPAGVALSLTGGLDSRAVLAWSGRPPGGLPCYTFAGPHRDCADVLIARRLADLCGQPHSTIRLGDEFFANFSALAESAVHRSDGAMDVSGAVELHVNQHARGIAPVRLTGNYGSEILRSHIAFRPGRLDRSLFTPGFARLLDTAEETYRAEAAGHRLTFIACKQVPWFHHARFAIEKSQLTPRSPFLDNELVALAYQVPGHLALSPRPLLDLIASGNSRFAAIGTDRGLRRRSVPLVSHVANSWHNFTAKAEYASDYGMPGWLARASRTVPRLRWERLFLGRHKFYHFRSWYRDQLAGAVRAQTDSANNPPLFCYRDDSVRRVVDQHMAGDANRTLELHQLLSVQLIDRLLIRVS
jgi:asparagine synthase (glutamine-hydrolysing)